MQSEKEIKSVINELGIELDKLTAEWEKIPDNMNDEWMRYQKKIDKITAKLSVLYWVLQQGSKDALLYC
mgnify:CR=1 FL=1